MSSSDPARNAVDSDPNAKAPRRGLLRSWFVAYLALLRRRPLLTKAITAGVTAIIGDILSQKLRGFTALDFTSMRNQFLIGSLFSAPLVHYWYELLEMIFAKQDPRSPKTVAQKVLVDQLLFCSVFNYLYFWVIGTLEGKPPAATRALIASEFKNVMVSNWMVWPLVSILNFTIIPPDLRVLFGNIIGIFWTAYIITASAKTQ